MQAPACYGITRFGHSNIYGGNANLPHKVWIFSTTVRKIPQYFLIYQKRKYPDFQLIELICIFGTNLARHSNDNGI